MAEKNTESFYLNKRHTEIITDHAVRHNLGRNRSLALRQILDIYAGSLVKPPSYPPDRGEDGVGAISDGKATVAAG